MAEKKTLGRSSRLSVGGEFVEQRRVFGGEGGVRELSRLVEHGDANALVADEVAQQARGLVGLAVALGE